MPCSTHGGQNNRQYCESSLCEEHCSTEKKSLSTFKSKVSHNPLAKIFTETGKKSAHVSIRQWRSWVWSCVLLRSLARLIFLVHLKEVTSTHFSPELGQWIVLGTVLRPSLQTWARNVHPVLVQPVTYHVYPWHATPMRLPTTDRSQA